MAGLSDSVTVTLFHVAVERASSGAHTQVASHWRGPQLLNALFGLMGHLAFAEWRVRTSHAQVPLSLIHI